MIIRSVTCSYVLVECCSDSCLFQQDFLDEKNKLQTRMIIIIIMILTEYGLINQVYVQGVSKAYFCSKT